MHGELTMEQATMSSSGHNATENNASRSLHDLAFVEPFARKLAALTSSNPITRLATLSCVAEILTLKEASPNAVSTRSTPSASSESYDADIEDIDSVDEDSGFETGERVRVQMGSRRESWQARTIADLKTFPPRYHEEGCCYPVLMQTRPRLISYIDTSHLTRIDPWSL